MYVNWFPSIYALLASLVLWAKGDLFRATGDWCEGTLGHLQGMNIDWTYLEKITRSQRGQAECTSMQMHTPQRSRWAVCIPRKRPELTVQIISGRVCASTPLLSKWIVALSYLLSLSVCGKYIVKWWVICKKLVSWLTHRSTLTDQCFFISYNEAQQNKISSGFMP